MTPPRRRPTRKSAPTKAWPANPVVAEVRRARAGLWNQAGRDINALFDLVHKEAAAPPRAARTRPARRKSA